MSKAKRTPTTVKISPPLLGTTDDVVVAGCGGTNNSPTSPSSSSLSSSSSPNYQLLLLLALFGLFALGTYGWIGNGAGATLSAPANRRRRGCGDDDDCDPHESGNDPPPLIISRHHDDDSNSNEITPAAAEEANGKTSKITTTASNTQQKMKSLPFYATLHDLQSDAMRQQMWDACPHEMRVSAIVDPSSLNTNAHNQNNNSLLLRQLGYWEFIEKTFTALNQPSAILHQRPLIHIMENYDKIWLKRGALTKGFYSEFGVFTGKTLRKAYRNLKLRELEPIVDDIIANVSTTNSKNTKLPHLTGPMAGFDSFQGLPEKWRHGFNAGAFGSETLYDEVRASLPEEVELHKGWFQETIPNFLAKYPTTPAALIHHDGDLFVSTAIAFSLLSDRIVPGTILCFDELHNYHEWEKHEMLSFYLWMIQTRATVCAIGQKGPSPFSTQKDPVTGATIKVTMDELEVMRIAREQKQNAFLRSGKKNKQLAAALMTMPADKDPDYQSCCFQVLDI